jgi:hypothetical protein
LSAIRSTVLRGERDSQIRAGTTNRFPLNPSFPNSSAVMARSQLPLILCPARTPFLLSDLPELGHLLSFPDFIGAHRSGNSAPAYASSALSVPP